MRSRCAPLLGLAGLLLGSSLPAAAQVRPDLPWRTIATERFRVHFTPELAALAERTLRNAEWGYARLAEELPVPRGMIDIVVADNLDLANGYATPFPTNRIVVYARPPVDELTLRNHPDWNLLLVVHELAHIFHLDRVAGWWGLGQRVFGRAAPLFPNAYAPRWLVEGIAIHYETALTGQGRLAGTEFPAHIRALARDGALPTIDGMTSPRPYFPGGLTPYLVGAQLVQRALRHDTTQGEGGSLARFLATSSRRINPWRHDAGAEASFGASFTELYAAWKDSVMRAAHVGARSSGDGGEREDARGETADDGTSRTLSLDGWTAAFPRFRDDGALVYVSDNARQMPGVYVLAGDAAAQRLSRRNNVDASVPLDARRAVYTEWDWTDPYSLRSDLYVSSGRGRRRVTVGERLSHVDVHLPTGRIVAVRTVPGSTELVTAEAIEGTPRVVVEGRPEVTWSEPRLSRDGQMVAAARWDEGGTTSIVVLGLDGVELQRIAPRVTRGPPRPAVVSAPAWLPGDSLIVFVSDHEGRAMIYLGHRRTGAYGLLWETETALRQPDVSADGTEIAAVELAGDGWHVVRRPMPTVPPLGVIAAVTHHDDEGGRPHVDRRGARCDHDGAGRSTPEPHGAGLAYLDRGVRYQGLALARPSWWLPAVGDVSDEGSLRVGLLTGGYDPVGRHTMQLRVARDVARASEYVWDAAYAYAGFGNPVLTIATRSEWVHGAIVNAAQTRVATLSRNDRTVSASVYLARPRARLSSYLLLAPELGIRTFRTTPAGARTALRDPELLDVDLLPTLALATGFSSMQRPGLSVSAEDGIAMQATLRRRFTAGVDGSAVHDVIVDGSAAKSIPLPGFARHVLAVRGARGAADAASTALFGVGGVSGTTIDLLPGLAVGDPRRTFFVRGFAPGTQVGTQAAAGSVEYRAPVVRVGRGLGLVPASIQKVSVLAFADAGSAWCTATVRTSAICQAGATTPRWLASAGGELVLDTPLQYDVLYRVRLGVAAPLRGGDVASPSPSFYISFGSTF